MLATGCTDEATPAATSATTHSAASTSPSSGPQKTPTVPGLAGRLVFAKAGGAYEDGTFFLMNADGTSEQAIDGADRTCCGGVSRDGSTLLVAGLTDDDRITVAMVPIDGGTPRLLPLPGSTLNLGPGAWSPDDKRIAVQGWDDTDHSKDGLYLVDSDDGGHRVRLTRAPEGHAHVPGDFSPDPLPRPTSSSPSGFAQLPNDAVDVPTRSRLGDLAHLELVDIGRRRVD